ncbi:hypothetical protein HAX54_008187 [Datura stramonium]|uniref:RNase H type-1 domain-containing protein n=1 Tax=Datura stramonium TaxID=4076 RepID=A0ABS8TEF6_DATST|nr:hypothetical protein [Datura stramonium]
MERRQQGMIKMNTDGSYINETGEAGIGVIARDDQGNLTITFYFNIKCRSNNEAEAQAARETNLVADALAKNAFKKVNLSILCNYRNLPSEAKGSFFIGITVKSLALG